MVLVWFNMALHSFKHLSECSPVWVVGL